MSAQIYLCNRPMKACHVHGVDEKSFLDDNPHLSSGRVYAGTPYILRDALSDVPSLQMQRDVKSLLTLPPAQRRNLSQLNQQLGSDLLSGLAEFYETEIFPASQQLNQWLNNEKINLAGAGTTLLAAQESRFIIAMKEYEKSLVAVRDAVKNKLPKFHVSKLEVEAKARHKYLQRVFKQELNYSTNKVKSKKGTALSISQRGIHLAKSSRTDAPITISNSKEIARLKYLSAGLKYGGRAVVAYDAYNRGNMIANDYKSGRDWKRTAVVQSGGFGASLGSGLITAKAVTGLALTVGLTATPIGWVIAIGIGLTATYFVATNADKFAQNTLGNAYDSL